MGSSDHSSIAGLYVLSSGYQLALKARFDTLNPAIEKAQSVALALLRIGCLVQCHSRACRQVRRVQVGLSPPSTFTLQLRFPTSYFALVRSHSSTLSTPTRRGGEVLNMMYCTPLRRLFAPAIVAFIIVALWRSFQADNLPAFILHPPPVPPPGIRIPIGSLQKPLPAINTTGNYQSPPSDFFYSYEKQRHRNDSTLLWQPALDANLAPLFQCSKTVNTITGHYRLPHVIQNISSIPSGLLRPEYRVFWNPTIIALPHWSPTQYLVVSRILTDGKHQENVLCEANGCYVGPPGSGRPGEKPCSAEDIKTLGPSGGLRCVAPPVTLSVPPTPAEKCEGKFQPYVDIPGFHDPRIFWSGKGEPLMMVNTQ